MLPELKRCLGFGFGVVGEEFDLLHSGCVPFREEQLGSFGVCAAEGVGAKVAGFGAVDAHVEVGGSLQFVPGTASKKTREPSLETALTLATSTKVWPSSVPWPSPSQPCDDVGAAGADRGVFTENVELVELVSSPFVEIGALGRAGGLPADRGLRISARRCFRRETGPSRPFRIRTWGVAASM